MVQHPAAHSLTGKRNNALLHDYTIGNVNTVRYRYVYGTECLFCAGDVGGQSRLTLQTHLINTVYIYIYIYIYIWGEVL